MQPLKIIITLLFCLSSLGTSYVWAYPVWDTNKQRKLFLKIHAEIEQGKWQNFLKNRNNMKNYVLYPYLQYNYLVKNIHNIKYPHVEKFADSYKSSPLAKKLRNEWFKHKAKTGDWQGLVNAYKQDDNLNVENKCNFLFAKWELHKNPEVFKEVHNLWTHGESRPKSCDPLFAAWEEADHLPKSLIWQRIKLAIQANNRRLARFLGKKLPPQEQKLVELWIRTHETPHLIKKTHYYNYKHPATVEILVHAMNKIARQDPNLAIKLWQRISKKHNFTERQWALTVKAIASGLAIERDPNASVWLSKIPDKFVDETLLDHKLRTYIYTRNWQAIATTFNKHEKLTNQDLKWRYWHANSLSYIGDKQQSEELLKKLATERHFYGFLASHKMAIDFPLHNKPSNVDLSIMNSLNKRTGVQRAKELHDIGWVSKANSEWRLALESMNEDERQAAALLAAKWQIPNWAITALAEAKYKNDLNLRFPRSHSPTIIKEAINSKLDPAWIFAITRQESAFTPTAKSTAGALGLMQVIPSTAKMVAKSNKMKLHSNNDLLIADKNIFLGTKYLKMLLEQYDYNPLLATAAYNAGPARVSQWLPPYDMPSDQWIELIPFKETRGYVQNVITYMIIYQSLMGKKPEIKHFMPTISMASPNGYNILER